MLRLKFLLSLLMAVFAAGAFGQAVHSDDTLMTHGWEHTLDLAAELPFPIYRHPKPGQVTVYVYAGANYGELIAVSSKGEDAPKIAAALAEATKGDQLGKSQTLYAEEDGEAVVYMSQSSIGFPYRRHTQTFNVPAYQAELTLAGFKPEIILRLPLHGDIKEHGFVQDASETSRYLFAGERAHPTEVSFTTELPVQGCALAIFLILLSGLGGPLGLHLGVLTARWSKGTPFARRRQFGNVVYVSCAVSIVLAMVAMFTLLMTGGYQPYFDLWFGSRLFNPLFPAAIGGAILMVPSLLAVKHVENILFGPMPKVPQLPDPPGGQAKLDRWPKVIIFAVTLGIFYPLAFCLPKPFRGAPIMSFGNSLALAAAMIWESRALRKFHAAAVAVGSDLTPWQSLADEVAEKIGVRKRRVRRSTDTRSPFIASASLNAIGELMISDRFMQLMTPDEARFHFAAVLGRPEDKTAAWKGLLAVVPLFAGVGIFIALANRVLDAVMALAGLAFIGLGFGYTKILLDRARHRRIEEYDRRGLQYVGDYAVARSAVLKAVNLPPELLDLDEVNPEVAKLVKRLQVAAQALGLSTDLKI